MTGTDTAELDQLPGWDSLVAAGAVEPPDAAVLTAAAAAVRDAVRHEAAAREAWEAAQREAAGRGAPGRGAGRGAPGRAAGRGADRRGPGRRAEPERPRLTRRRALGLAVAAGAAALAVAVPAVLPAGTPGSSGPAAAAAAERLALTAEAMPADRIGPGQFRYVVLAEAELMEGDPGPTAVRREQWIAADGGRWERVTRPGAGTVVDHFPARGDGGFTAPTPGLLAGLPRDPRQLVDFLLPRVEGSASPQEAVFVALADMLRSDLADSRLRACMLRAIGLLPDVAVDDGAVDGQGRRGIALVWTRDGGEGVTQTVVFDRATASVLEERSAYRYDTPRQPDSSRGLSHTSTTVESRLVGRVPPEIVRDARQN